MICRLLLIALLVPTALFAQARRPPTYRPPDGTARAARVLERVQDLDGSLRAFRRVFVDTLTGTAQWLELEPSAVPGAQRMPTAETAAQRFLASYGVQLFGRPLPPRELELVETDVDNDLTHFRYVQRFEGWRVYAGELRVHVARINGRYAVQSLNGRIYADVDAPRRPLLSFDAALQAAGGSRTFVERPDTTPLIVPDQAKYRLAYEVYAPDPVKGIVVRYVDSQTGEVFAEAPGVISDAFGPTAATGGRPGLTPSKTLRSSMGYVATYGTDVLNNTRNFNVWQASGSLYQMASNGWPGITQVEIRNFNGSSIFSGDCASSIPYVSTSSIATGWPTTANGKEEVSAVANFGATFQYLNTKFSRKGVYDNVSLSPARACVHGVALDLGGNETFNAVFYPSNFTWGFVRTGPGFLAAAAAQDVVTHEIWHGVNADEVNFDGFGDPAALNEGLSDYFGARHNGSSCLAGAALGGNCLRQLNSAPNLADLETSCDGEPHCLSVAYSSALWTTSAKFANYGDPTDWATYNGLRNYMTQATTWDLGRESVVRAAKDRLHNNQTNVNITFDLEDAFYVRGIGPAAVSVSLPASSPCNAWFPDVTGSGTRSFVLWFAAGVGFFNDGAVDHQFYSINLGTFTDATLPSFTSSQVGNHTIDDGHSHTFLFRFTDVSPSVGFLDYYAPSGTSCGITPVARKPVETSDEPQTFAVRQSVARGSAAAPSSATIEASASNFATSVAAEIRSSGVTALEIDIPANRAGERLEVTIFDLQGRPVRTITEDAVPLGRRTLVWDRMTSRGEVAPAGVYTVIVRYGSASHRTRFVIPRSEE